MKEQTPFRKTEGKTVQKVNSDDDVLIILWTDDTFSCSRYMDKVDSLESGWEDLILSLEPHPAWHSSQLWWPAKLVELGIVTDVEIKESEAKVAAAQHEQRIAQEKATYERLKAQFEGTT